MRQKPRSDADLESMIGVQRNDPIGTRVGKAYTRKEIENLEEQKAPWLKFRRTARWVEQLRRSN